jgi:ribonuclease P protein component
MLSREYRFHGPNSLRFVYRNGQTAHSRLFKVKSVANPRRKNPRFAIVVSKKVHKSAVGRNRIRRRLYEAIRHELPRLKPGMDVVLIVVSGEALAQSSADQAATLEQLFKEANLYK